MEYITITEHPELVQAAAAWFENKWGIPQDAYAQCMLACIHGETDYNWYLCMEGSTIVGGLGVIENDFHNRPDLTPNICAVYTAADYRCQGIAGRLLDFAVDDLRRKGISPVYLLTGHDSFYERYGWEYLCPVRGDGEAQDSRMYIHR